MKICFIAKKEKMYVNKAIKYLNRLTTNIDVYYCELFESFPHEIKNKEYDIIISYISNWIIPKTILESTKMWNINFHPGPPEYPGIGCFNFAIYNSSKEYGVTAHIMDAKVDTGKIIGVKRFSMDGDETVLSLSDKTYLNLYYLYKEIINYILLHDKVPASTEDWKRKPYKRMDLEKLSTITKNMDKEELEKVIRATYYDGKPGPFIEIFGYRFEYNPDR